MFTPKARRGHWSTTVETEAPHDCTSDDRSERSILKRTPEESENIEIRRNPSRKAALARSDDPPHHIKKTMQVDVIYDQA